MRIQYTFQAHAYIISSLHQEMPMIFGKDTKKIELISNLDQIYSQLERKYLISPGDFPELKKMQASVYTSWFIYLFVVFFSMLLLVLKLYKLND
jgi:hypothetical protein